MSEPTPTLGRGIALLVSALALVGQVAGCADRIRLNPLPDQIGPVWVEPDVRMPDRVNLSGDFSHHFALYGLVGLAYVVAIETAESAQEEAASEGIDELGTVVRERFMTMFGTRGLMPLSESDSVENRIRLHLKRVEMGKFHEPALSVEIEATLIDANGSTIWSERQPSRRFSSDVVVLDDYISDPDFRRAAFTCVIDNALEYFAATVTGDFSFPGLHCGEALDIARRKRREESERLEKRVTNTISGFRVTCTSPHELKQDCSFWNGPHRRVRLGGRVLRIAGSEEGRIVRVASDSQIGDILTKRATTMTRAAALAVLTHLEDRGIGIVGITEIDTSDQTLGIIFELDGDGYALLKEHTEN